LGPGGFADQSGPEHDGPDQGEIAQSLTRPSGRSGAACREKDDRPRDGETPRRRIRRCAETAERDPPPPPCGHEPIRSARFYVVACAAQDACQLAFAPPASRYSRPMYRHLPVASRRSGSASRRAKPNNPPMSRVPPAASPSKMDTRSWRYPAYRYSVDIIDQSS